MVAAQHLMKRIQRGPVRGISLKLQEEERERRLDFIPEVSALQTENIPVDKDTMEMLKMIGLGNMANVEVESVRFHLPLNAWSPIRCTSGTATLR
jgi:small subunit ribosomal protein S17e